MARAVGIDLGTTYSAVAVLDDAGIPVILRNAQGGSTTESVVLFEQSGGKDAPVVGGAAKRQAGVRPDDIVQHVKRYMGDPSWRFDSATDTQYRSEEISAIILRALVRDAEAALGEPISDVVITVPAYFDDSRRTATQQAGAIAGLNVLRVLNEPTAAALAYGLGTDEDGIVLVYDLGGGTFDVSILGIEGRSFTTLATDGDRNLGGFDWDNALMKLVVGELESVHGVTDFYDDVDAVAELREKAEHAKRALSTVDSTSIQLSYRGTHYSITVTREQFEAASASLLRRTQELVEDTLDTSGLEWDDIASVLLVGGSTRMPAVRALMDRISGITPVDGIDPDEAVALGAAIQAALSDGESTAPGLDGVEIADVTSHALGTTALDENTVIKNWVIIDRNTKIPAQGMEVLTTSAPRTEIYVWVTQGDDPDVDFVTEIGHGVIQLSEEWPAGVDFAVVYRYDIDQTVTVEVYRMPDEEYVGAFEIDRVANLTEAKVAEAAEKLDRLEVPVVAAPPVATKSAPMTRLAPLGTTGQENGQVRLQQTAPATEGNRP